MGDHITGIKLMKEISATVKGANEHATKVFRKTFVPPTAPAPTVKLDQVDPDPAVTEESSEMDVKIIKSLAGLQARTGNTGALYVAGLEDDKVKSFFEQDAAAQDAEVKAWDDAEKVKAAEAETAEKAKSAKDPTVVALEDKVKTLEANAVKSAEAARTVEIEKTAASLYSKVPKAVEVLKSIDGLTAEQQAPILANLAATQELAKSLGKTAGDDTAIPGDATAKHDTLVAEVAKTKSITKAEATLLVSQDPANAELIGEMRAEMAG